MKITFVTFIFLLLSLPCTAQEKTQRSLEAINHEWSSFYEPQIEEELRQNHNKKAKVYLAIYLQRKIFLQKNLDQEKNFNATKEKQIQEIREIFSNLILEQNENRISTLNTLPISLNREKDIKKYSSLTEDQREALQSYEGQDQAFANLFSFIANNYADGTHIPCEWLIDQPAFIEIMTPISGGSRDGRLPVSYCNQNSNVPPLPKEVLQFKEDIISLGDRKAQAGTLTSSIAASEHQANHLLQFYPEYFLDPEKFNPEAFYRKNVEILAQWQLYSYWNYNKAQKINYNFKQAVKKLSLYYKSILKKRGNDPSQSELAAERALMNILIESKTPIKNDIRYAILNDFSKNDIAERYTKCNPSIPKEEAFSDILTPNPKIGTPEPATFLAIKRPDILEMLITKCGFKIDEKNNFGKTLLMTAAHFNTLDTIKVIFNLIPDSQKIAYLNAQTNNPFISKVPKWGIGYELPQTAITHGNRTALMYAAENASKDVIEFLLTRGADKCIKDSQGLTAFNYMIGDGPSNFINPNLSNKEIKELTPHILCK